MNEDTKTKALPVGAPWGVGQVREVELHLSSSTLIVECLVHDTRRVYGRTEFQITPVAGSGSAWISPEGKAVTLRTKADKEARQAR